MAEIGEMLREARMRRRIDMTEVESATKIRGKYLRALENEEWDLLPGPTFVKTFLRTYAEYLGLDPRLLVEEYRQRYERPSTQDLTPFSASRAPRARGRVRRRRAASLGPLLVIAACTVVLLGALWALGTWGDDDKGTPPPPNSVGETEEPTATPSGDEQPREEEPEQRPQRVRLQLVATAPVYVCVVDARGRQVVDEETLDADSPRRTFTSRSFRTNFGNNNVSMRVNGRTYRVEPSTEAIGYLLRPGRRPQRLPDSQRPDCSS